MEPQQHPAPAPQPYTPPVPVQQTEQHAAAHQHASVYHSNPFIVMLNQLSLVLKVNPISTLTLGLLMVAVLVAMAFIGGIIAALGRSVIIGVVLVVAAVITYILIVLRFTAASVYLHSLSRAGQTVTAREAVKQAAKHNYNKFIATAIVTGLIVGVGMIALILPGLFLLGRLILAPYIAMNEGLGVGASIKRSWKLTSGHWFETIGALVAQIVVVPSGILAFVGGQSGINGRYFELIELEKSGATKPKTHWMNYLIVGFGAVFVIIYGTFIGLSYNRTSKVAPCSEAVTFKQLSTCTDTGSSYYTGSHLNTNPNDYNYDGSN